MTTIPLPRRCAGVLALIALALLTLAQPLQPDAHAAQSTASALAVQYPSEHAHLPYVTRSFIFGAAPRGATLSVNGARAFVAPSGGWIAFVPFSPGSFALNVVADVAASHSSLRMTRTVLVDEPPQTTRATPATIDAAAAAQPQVDQQLEAGDAVRLFVKASVGARVSATLDPGGPTVTLLETSVAALNPSDKERALGDAVAAGDNIGGLYEGALRVPASGTGPWHVTYAVSASDGTSQKTTARGTIALASADAHRVGTIILADHAKDIDARPYGIVESEPNGGWLFFPPAGTPFEITGASGDYFRVALGSAQQGWIDKQSLNLQPAGTLPPRAQVEDIAIRDGVRSSSVSIHLSARVPFRISESSDQPALRIRMYGASASTDFIRYGSDRSNVASVRGDELPGGVATVDIRLHQHGLWGYHADWHGNEIQLDVKKPPPFSKPPAPALRGLLVVIDPGHSPDTGAIGPLGTQERDVNLAIAKRLAARLQALGARTLLTRYANVPVGLYDRTLLAARAGADILISVHNNALPDGIDPFRHHGYSVYYYQPQSLELARAIHAAYGRRTALADYGLFFDNLALARPTEQPSVLTESAFIMWPPEETLLRS
ncbi:MAG: N-acetylmuramoyl-L-alanine amidase, partial [Candidatus Eremiobacteraeota bacterium]|nr:N-acetylmuramoyl-L-alanine amidase [Candidatus Eremiobacteraeota bacterium]